MHHTFNRQDDFKERKHHTLQKESGGDSEILQSSQFMNPISRKQCYLFMSVPFMGAIIMRKTITTLNPQKNRRKNSSEIL